MLKFSNCFMTFSLNVDFYIIIYHQNITFNLFYLIFIIHRETLISLSRVSLSSSSFSLFAIVLRTSIRPRNRIRRQNLASNWKFYPGSYVCIPLIMLERNVRINFFFFFFAIHFDSE